MSNCMTKLVVLACILTSPVLSLAQNQGADDVPQRIAVINIQQAIGETAEGKKVLADLQKKYEPRRADLEQQNKEITALQDQLQNQSSMLSADEQYHLNHELQTKQRRFKEAQEDAQDDFQTDTQEAVRDIGQKMIKLIGQYAQQHRYSLVIGDQQVPIYYAAKTVDITEDIVHFYDSSYPISSVANPAKSPSTPAHKGVKAK